LRGGELSKRARFEFIRALGPASSAGMLWMIRKQGRGFAGLVRNLKLRR